MDKLKEYLQDHKADLDRDSPADDTWDSIASKIPAGKPKTTGSVRIIRFAAAACLIALAGAGLWLVAKKDKTPPDTAKQTNPIPPTVEKPREETPPANTTTKPKQKPAPQKLTKESDEVANIDKSYATLINHELRKLRATPLYAENGNYFSFYTEQLKEMDKEEQTVRKDIKKHGLNTATLDQLIDIYQQKLNLLKRLQTEINKMNNKVREKQAPSERPEVHYLNI